ncbi:MAG TPA: flavodoxin domain-containing protein [Clostridia bacterium]|nr:flavodoxin domain-containing protein [Clostridia bacterium]
MGKIKVAFATKTQHSRKIAEAIGEKLGAEILNIRNKPHVSSVETLIIVGGVYAGKCNLDILAFAEGLTSAKVKKAILITSSASVSNRSQKELREVLVKKGIDVIGGVACTGAFLFIKLGHPNKIDMQEVADKVMRFVRIV